MAQRDRGMRILGAGEALACELAHAGIMAAVEALRSGGYSRPTDEQFGRIAHAVTREALAAGLAIHATGTEFTDDELDQAAMGTAHAAVRDVLGPPPRMN